MEVHNIVHEAVMKTIPEKKKFKKAKWLYEELLQLEQEIKEVKGKGRKGKIQSTECRVQRKQGEIFLKAFLNEKMQRSRGKQ